MTNSFDVDVVVAGGGPVGIVVGTELHIARVETVVLERLAERSPHSKAFGLHARSLEMLDRRGLIEKFRDGARTWNNGHFAGLDAWVDFSALDSNHGYALLSPQARTERLLEERAQEYGLPLLRGHEITAVHADDDGVTVAVTGPDGPYELRARYLVGADGAHSQVRRAAGIDFPGTGGRVTARMGDVRLARPDEAPMGMERTDKGLIFCVPIEDGYHRMATFDFGAPRPEGDGDLTLDELRASMLSIWGTDYGMHDPTWLSWFTDSARQAQRYRQGRILLAGDAAHVHFPVGGQGLNLGLQDAFNLGWKLAAEVHGWAPPGLLDSYDAERQGPARRVIDNTRAQIALMNPDPDVTPLRVMFTDLMAVDAVNLHLAEMLSGVGVRYDLDTGDVPAHPLVGEFAPDLLLHTDDGDKRLAELLRRGNGLLLNLDARAEIETAADVWAAPLAWAGRVRRLTATSKQEPDLAGLLVRPDGYVAWAADRDTSAEQVTAGLGWALRHWFGDS